ncbi:MAG: hypothetical protein QXU79_02985 [Candidatus Micrarchaeaceae archaeon]
MYNASRYCLFTWTPGANNVNPRVWTYFVPCTQQWETHTMTSAFTAGTPVTGVAYKWGGGDYIDDYPAAGDNDYFLRRLANGDLAGDVNNNRTLCPGGWWYKPVYPNAAGVDCSGFVTRVWGRPTGEKWDTGGIAANSILIPYNVRNDDLPRRMRMGDVFNDWIGDSRHVVVLYYFDRQNTPIGPRFYESNWSYNRVRFNEGGWAWLEANGGWWNGTDGYRPYRYSEIRDDIYLPWLSYAWYGWETTLYARNNSTTARTYVLQHTAYGGGGGDVGAINTGTYRRTTPFANDIWELPTSILNPGSGYRGAGVVAADTGDSAVVLVQDTREGLAYTGIFPFDTLGQATANRLYMPVFLYTPPWYQSKIFVQNAGKVATNVTATYYGDDGRTCSHPVGTLEPWGSAITHPEHCNWGGNPPASGSVVLSANQPLAAITLETIDWNRVGGYNAFSQGSTFLYVPELTRNGWGIGWNSTLHLMNVGGDTVTVTVKYYAYGGGSPFCSDVRTLAPNRHTAIDHGGQMICVAGHRYDVFSAIIESPGQPVVAVVNEDNAYYRDFQAYNAAIAGKNSLVLPIIRKGNYYGEVWAASSSVQNTVGSNNQVTLTFYDQAGNWVGSTSRTLSPYGSYLFYSEIPNDFSGSVVIGAQQPVVAVGSLFNTALSGDGAMRYNAVEKKGISQLGLPEEETGEE